MPEVHWHTWVVATRCRMRLTTQSSPESVISGNDKLSPAEEALLLDPRRARPPELIKIAILGLLAHGVIRLRSETKRQLLLYRTVVTFELDVSRVGQTPPVLDSLVAVIRSAIDKGGTMQQVAHAARQAFGTNLTAFKEQLLEALVRRGLLETSIEPFLLIFARTAHRLTPVGASEQARIQVAVACAERLPALLDVNPAKVSAIALAAGSAILLVPELKKHYGRLGRVMNEHPDTDAGSDGMDWSSPDDSSFAASMDFSGFDANSLSFFDSGTFSALDSALAGFDASFDSSFSGDGGGDSGGHGGH